MVDAKPKNLVPWNIIKGLMPAMIDDDRGRDFAHKRDGLAYYAVKQLAKHGVTIDVPDEVEAAMNPPAVIKAAAPPATVAPAAEDKNALIKLGGGVLDGVKSGLGKLWHSQLNPLPHEAEETKPKEEG